MAPQAKEAQLASRMNLECKFQKTKAEAPVARKGASVADSYMMCQHCAAQMALNPSCFALIN